MALKKYKPTTPGQRFKVISAFDEITTDKPEKSLLRPKKSTGGRNSSGEMTVPPYVIRIRMVANAQAML